MSEGLSISLLPQREDGALQSALEREAHVMGELIAVVLRQRTGVEQDDLGAVRDSVYAAHRLLLTLEQARRHRRSLLELHTGDPDTPLGMLESALGGELAPGLAHARDELLSAARTLSHEVAVNRQVVRGAASSRGAGGSPHAAPGQSVKPNGAEPGRELPAQGG